MTFSQRFLIRLLVVPALTSLPLGIGFIALVLRLSPRDLAVAIALSVLLALTGALILKARLQQPLARFEAGLRSESDVSHDMSDLFRRAVNTATILSLAGGVLFAVAASLLILPSPLGFGYFLVAALISAALGIPWVYVAAKQMLLSAVGNRPSRYIGPRFSIARKIAIVFIGFFIVSALALVQLISSKVATTLEKLAISTAQERFDRVYGSAILSAKIDDEIVSTLKEYLPAEYELHRISRDGRIASSKGDLSSGEIQQILRRRNGNSAAFISPHVSIFKELNDGSILALSIPWAPYRNIPVQITFYTLLVSLITCLLFSIAAYLLGRDVTRPVGQLTHFASELAAGNFQTDARVFSDDEIADLADSFGQTRNNLRQLLGRVGGSGTSITDGVRVINGGTERLLERSREQMALTDHSTRALQNVRAGIGAVLQAAGTVSELTQDSSIRAIEMQSSAEEVARSVDHLFGSVEKTSASTLEMSAAATAMSQRTEGLARISEEVLSFVTEMDSTNNELRQSAQSTAEISRKVREDAVIGGEAVDATLAGIRNSQLLSERTADVLGTLQKSVSEITQILSVIEEITERTNLLALNAAIIAAQAGEHGLGFSVVADEIRELAEKTRGSTKQISGIIKAVQSGSRDAVRAVQEGVTNVRENADVASGAARSLSKIVASSSNSYDMANRISKALIEQSQASRHLHEVTSKMSDHIAENNRSIQEQARGTQLLASEADSIRDVASQVKSATEQQLSAGSGISRAMGRIADDTRSIRDLLESQLRETEEISSASQTMRDIARQNDAIANDFNATVNQLIESGRDFETEVRKFRYSTEN